MSSICQVTRHNEESGIMTRPIQLIPWEGKKADKIGIDERFRYHGSSESTSNTFRAPEPREMVRNMGVNEHNHQIINYAIRRAQCNGNQVIPQLLLLHNAGML